MLQPGATLHRGYVIEAVLGKGGMGAVYLARQNTLGGRRVAIKETTIQVEDPAVRSLVMEQFTREAHILAAIDHPNLVDVKDFFEENGAHYLVMAYIDGETLQQVLERSPGPLPIEQVLTWLDPLCDVLAVLHEHATPVLVRDLKPSNVMIDRNGRIRLIDFGIARVQDSASARTSHLLKGAGTVGYAPAEQFGGQGTDARADIYALGATLYALITRTVPPWSVHVATGEAVLKAPSTINPTVPPSLDAVVLRMMASRRDERYASVREARQALQGVLAELRGARALGATPSLRFCITCGSAVQVGQTACTQCGDDLTHQARRIESASGGHPTPAAPGATIPQPPPRPQPPRPLAAGKDWRARLPLIFLGIVVLSVGRVFMAYWNARPPAPASLASPAPLAVASPAPVAATDRSPSAVASASPSSTPSAIAVATPEPTPTPRVALQACVDNLAALQNSLDKYKLDNQGKYPGRLDDLGTRYIRAVPTCPTAGGAPYAYACSTTPNAYTVMCAGANHGGTRAGRSYPRLDSRTGLHEHNPDLDIMPTTAQQWFDRGFAAYQCSDYEAAQYDFRQACSLDPEWSGPIFYIGECLFAQAQYEAAAETYTRALSIRKTALYYRARGSAYTQLAKFRKAIDDFVEADNCEKNDPETYAAHAFALYLMERFDDALGMCDLALRQDPRNEVAIITRYWCELCLGKGAALATDAQGFLAAAGWTVYQSPYSVLVGSFGYEMEKRNPEAKALLDTGLRRLKRDWPYPCVQYVAGQIDQASLLEAATDGDRQTEARFYIGVKAALEGRTDDARAALSWVRDNGRKTFFEFPAALAWLKRL